MILGVKLVFPPELALARLILECLLSLLVLLTYCLNSPLVLLVLQLEFLVGDLIAKIVLAQVMVSSSAPVHLS